MPPRGVVMALAQETSTYFSRVCGRITTHHGRKGAHDQDLFDVQDPKFVQIDKCHLNILYPTQTKAHNFQRDEPMVSVWDVLQRFDEVACSFHLHYGAEHTLHKDKHVVNHRKKL